MKIFLVLILSALSVGLCQDVPIRVDVNVVNVFCSVYDSRGAIITDLSRDDFEIRENGQSQPIRYFARQTDLPITVALLVDVSGSVRRFVQSEKSAAIQFFQGVLRPTDQAMILGFSSTVVLWRDFTSSVPELGDALTAMHAVPFRGLPKDGGPTPTTLLYDAVSSTAANKLRTVGNRKAMVIISDGIDLGSRAKLETAARNAQTADAIVYSICFPNKYQSGCGYLRTLSEPTGGRMFDLRANVPLAEIFHTIEEELRNQYLLGYSPMNSDRDGTFRKLQVKVKTKGMRVFARHGYYAS